MMIARARDFLLDAQNPDGGWGAGKGRRSNTEATALALLGLSTLKEAAPATNMASIDRGLNWLVERQYADGSWSLTDQVAEASWATALAVLALACFEDRRHHALHGGQWLLRQHGQRLGWIASLQYRLAPETMAARLNPDLQGWSWAANTFSWVEPTAYALMALKKLRPYLHNAHAVNRVHQGELLLYDRRCKGGGWNYGNSSVLREDLEPYPDVTAVALVALHDRQTERANKEGLSALQRMLTEVQSGLTLSWSILCFALYCQDTTEWKKLLARSYEQTEFLGETKTFALALLASSDAMTIFRV